MRRVVLLGGMCSGKSTTARALARLLGWTTVDLDGEVERLAGATVAEVFARDGEARFRALEAEATRALAGREGVVLAPGGGWATNPDLLPSLGPGTLSAWLRVTPEVALRRSGARPGTRPLLRGPDPLGTLRRLLAEREPLYARAEVAVDTDDLSPAQVAARLEAEIRARGTLSRATFLTQESNGG